MTDPIDTRMTDAIEHALWQDLADALNRLHAWGLMPHGDEQAVDAGDTIHGAGVREGGYMLRHTTDTSDPNSFGGQWRVVAREDTA